MIVGVLLPLSYRQYGESVLVSVVVCVLLTEFPILLCMHKWKAMKNPRPLNLAVVSKSENLFMYTMGQVQGLDRGCKTIAYMGYVVRFDEHQRKWLVCVVLCLSVSLMIVSALNLSDSALLLSPG